MLQTASVKAPIKSVQRGRLGQMLKRQQELRNQLVCDPLLDLKTVQAVLGVSYGTLNRLLVSGKLAFFQIGRGARKVRQSALSKLLAQGDHQAEVKANGTA